MAEVRIFDGADGHLINSFQALNPGFRGGATLAVGDINGDGKTDIIVGAKAGGSPLVQVYDGNNFTLLQSFLAFDSAFQGGVSLAAGDIDGDGKADIIVGAGSGGVPVVSVFSGATGANIYTNFAFDPNFRGGVNVAAGDIAGEDRFDIIAGAGTGGVPVVTVVNPNEGIVSQAIMAFDPAFRGGVRASVIYDVNGNASIVAAATRGSDAIATFAKNSSTANSVTSGIAGFAGGVSIANGTPISQLNRNASQVVIDWNTVALNAIRTAASPPTVASRALAILQAAEYDAVNGILRIGTPYLVQPGASATASTLAATAQAAHDILVALYPTQKATFDSQLTTSLAKLDDRNKADGIAWGSTVAQQILMVQRQRLLIHRRELPDAISQPRQMAALLARNGLK